MADKQLAPIILNGTDLDLRNALLDRGLPTPEDDDKKLMRTQAIRLLRDWKQDYDNVKPERNCRVIFHASTNANAGPYVFASLNSRTYQIPYEKEVTIPESILRECIDRAKITEYRQTQNENDKYVVTTRKVPVYPYTFICYEDEKVA